MTVESSAPSHERHRLPRTLEICITVVGLALVLLLLTNASGASAATFLKVQNFAPTTEPGPNPPTWPEDVQLGGASGMAINLTGAGGVEPGTVYTVGFSFEWHAARYSPTGEFELAWTQVNRCGPKVTPPSACPTYSGGSGGGLDIAVDQVTGNVYVFSVNDGKVVKEYNADGTNAAGTGPITEFGERDASGTITISPGKVHGSPGNENIAVSDSGAVYIFDEDFLTDAAHRVMVFKPQAPGDLEHYVYAGQGSDFANEAGSNSPLRPVLDEAGHVYIAGETDIEEYDPTQPTTPICRFSLPAGGLVSMTVDPANGAPFYYSIKDRLIHQLSPCDAKGEFVEEAASPPFAPVPQRGNIEAMAFNPDLEWAEEEEGGETVEHPAGVLYAAASRECPNVGGCPADAKGKSSQGYIYAPAIPERTPVITSEGVSGVRATTAVLHADINPKGPQTSYVFQYIPEAAYQANGPTERFAGAVESPPGGTILGSGLQSLSAAVDISGLSPATNYRFRVVATNPAGTVPGPDATFRTLPVAGGLPDARAYELVSPAQKNGGEVLPGNPTRTTCGVNCKPGKTADPRFPVRVSPGGDSIGYEGSPFLVNEGASEFDGYVSSRGPSGWETTSLSPPLLGDAGGAGFTLFSLSSDLTSAIVYAKNQPLTPEAPPGYLNLFRERTADRFGLSPLLTTAGVPLHREPNEGPNGFNLTYVGASQDYSRQFFEANDALTEASPNAPAAQDGGAVKNNLYEWSGGQLHLVNVQPLNTEAIPGAAFGSGFQLSTGESAPATDFSNAISADGSRVFWTSATGQLLVRMGGERTIEVPSPSNCKSSTPRASRVCFVTASADGSRVLLSNGSIYQLNEEEGAYEALVDLTQGLGGFQGLVGQSNDLGSVYFVATTVLTNAPNDRDAFATASEDNLYAWNGGTIAFVGTLLETDLQEFGTWKDYPVRRSAEASPDGRWLTFNSEAELIGPSKGNCGVNPETEEFFGPAPCGEVYLYDSSSRRLTCPSCNPTGTPPLGASYLLQMTGANGHLEQPRYLTNDGRVLFDSRDALASSDINDGVEDVYEYEPSGVGSCVEAAGCVSLISAGTGAYDSNFLAMDASGDNVFFTTRQRLVARDQDGLIDLYDARVDGGVASEAIVPPRECQAEGCQTLVPAPSEPTANSATSSPGGKAQPQCKKGKVKRKGKCLKKPEHRKKHRKHRKKHGKHKKDGKQRKAESGAGGSK